MWKQWMSSATNLLSGSGSKKEKEADASDETLIEEEEEEDFIVVPSIPQMVPINEEQPSLPIELWYDILHRLGRADLPAVSCVCQTWRAIILTDVLPHQARLAGRVCVVTGGTSGVGREMVLYLAAMGAIVCLGVRNMEKAEAVKEEILKDISDMRGIRTKPHSTFSSSSSKKRRKILEYRREQIPGALASLSAQIELIPLNLNSFASVKSFVETFHTKHSRLDVIVLSAAICPVENRTTEDGLEEMVQVNFLSHFLLTNLLLPSLRESPSGGKVIAIGCGVRPNTQQQTDFDPSTYFSDIPTFAPGIENLAPLFLYYVRSKICLSLFALELHSRCKKDMDRIQVHLVYPHPHHTTMWDDVKQHFGFLLNAMILLLTSLLLKQPHESTASFLEALLDTIEHEELPVYADSPNHIREIPITDPGDKASQLWAVSEKLTKLVQTTEEGEGDKKEKEEEKDKDNKDEERPDEEKGEKEENKEDEEKGEKEESPEKKGDVEEK